MESSQGLVIGLISSGGDETEQFIQLLANHKVTVERRLSADAVTTDDIANSELHVWLLDLDDDDWTDSLDDLLDQSTVPVFFHERGSLTQQSHPDYWMSKQVLRLYEMAGVEHTNSISKPSAESSVAQNSEQTSVDTSILEEETEQSVERLEKATHSLSDTLRNLASEVGEEELTEFAEPMQKIADDLSNDTDDSNENFSDNNKLDSLSNSNESSPETTSFAEPNVDLDNDLDAFEEEMDDFLSSPSESGTQEVASTNHDSADASKEGVLASDLQDDEFDLSDLDLESEFDPSQDDSLEENFSTQRATRDGDALNVSDDDSQLANHFGEEKALDEPLDSDQDSAALLSEDEFNEGDFAPDSSEKITEESNWELDLDSLDPLDDSDTFKESVEDTNDESHNDASASETLEVNDWLSDPAETVSPELNDSNESSNISNELEDFDEIPLLDDTASGSHFEQFDDITSVEQSTPSFNRNVWLLGASLGGPAAVKRFLQALPEKLPVAFILAQHIDDNFVPVLCNILETQTPFDAVVVDQEYKLEHGTVYIAPISHRLKCDQNGFIGPTDKSWSAPYAPSIDDMVTDVITTYSAQCGVVIFSGMGEDGKAALQEHYNESIPVWTQNTESCANSNMPDSIRDSGFSNFSGTPEELAEQLAQRYKMAVSTTE